MSRLSLTTVSRVPDPSRPDLDPRERRVRMVHLGLGAFHRAHQAQYTDEASDWGICGVTQRSAAVRDVLAPQDGLYTVLERGADGAEARVVGALREVLSGPDEPGALTSRLADPDVRVVTLTVTENGYRTGPDTAIARLVRGLAARRDADAGPIALLSCDNLAHNGAVLRRLVLDGVDDRMREWVEQSVRFPSSMVDRIVPAPTDADRAEVARLIGVDDAGAVATETFRQWVVEDDFPGGRPAWQDAGVLLTDDVRPYELIKLRMLNAAHSLLAYRGLLAGCVTIAEAVELFGDEVTALWAETRPTLDVPAGFDLDAYERDLLDRFANPALRHATAQVGLDGSLKLPQRLVPIVRDVRAAGNEPRAAATGIAAWMRWAQVAPDLRDPLAAEVRAAADAPPAAAVDGLLAIIGPDLADDAVVRTVLVEELTALQKGTA